MASKSDQERWVLQRKELEKVPNMYETNLKESSSLPDDVESPEEDNEYNVPLLIIKYEDMARSSSGTGYGAERPTRSSLAKQYPSKSSQPQYSRKKQTKFTELGSRDKSYGSQKPTRPFLTKHDPTESDKVTGYIEKQNRPPGLGDSDKGYGSRGPTRSLPTEQCPPKSGKSPAQGREETRSPGKEISSNLQKGKTKMDSYNSLDVFQKPLCLITTDPDGKLQVNGEVLDQIGQIDLLLNIVCIAGPYRTGKSYLLTRLAGVNKGFALGNTIQPKTKGIWVWCLPHPVKMDQVLLLLDTEGLGDIEKGDKNNDNQILALGVLLSSTMVYNILSKLSKDDMDTLSLVTEISKNIKFSNKMSFEESSSNFDRIFPTFVLSLRDFALKLEFEGNPITSDEYFEKVCLKLLPDQTQTNRDKNRAPLCLREYFKTRKCFTFDIPGGRNILSKLEEVQDDQLTEDFIKDTKLFTDYVYNECPPKQMNNGYPVNGRRFVILAKEYVGAIRDGQVPNVEDALATMKHQENTRAIEESVNVYLSEMNKVEYPTPDSSTLSATHKRCFDDALEFFCRNSMQDEDGNCCNALKDQIGKEYAKFRARDQDESMKKSQKALAEMDIVIQRKVDDGCYHLRDGYLLYLKDMKELETDYNALTGLGCKKRDTLHKYHRDTESRTQIIMLSDKNLTEKEKEIEAEKHKKAETERREEAEKSLREEQERLRKENDLCNKKAYEEMLQKYERELQNERDHLKRLMEQRNEEQARLEKEGLLNEAERLKINMEKDKNKLEEYEKEGVLSLLAIAAKSFASKFKFWK